MNINTGRPDAMCDIAYVEKKYKASWVGQLPLRTKDGQWSTMPADIYWQETPPVEGYSNYFALFINQGVLYITSGAAAVEGTFNAVVADNGEVIYSRCRHDYRESTDGSVTVDGGRDYCRTSAKSLATNFIQLKIVDGQWVEV